MGRTILVQDDSFTSQQSRALPSMKGWRILFALMLGFMTSSLLIYVILSGVFAPAWEDGAYRTQRANVLVVFGVAVVAVEASSLIRRRLSPLGFSRQTPKNFLYNSRLRPTLGAFLWGLDTGTSISTFRVSGATWVLVGGAVLGFTPSWVGAAYAVGFLVPTVALIAAPMHEASTAGIGRLLRRSMWIGQVACLTLLVATILVLAR